MENKDNNVVWEYETIPAPEGEDIKDEAAETMPDETANAAEGADVIENAESTAEEIDESLFEGAENECAPDDNVTADEPYTEEAPYEESCTEEAPCEEPSREEEPDSHEFIYEQPEIAEEPEVTEEPEIDLDDIQVEVSVHDDSDDISVAPVEELPKPTKKDKRKQMKEMSDGGIRSKRIIDRIFLVLTLLLFAIPVGLLIYIIIAYFL